MDQEDQNEVNRELDTYQKCIHGCGACGSCLIISIPCCWGNIPYVKIQQSHDGVIERFGQYTRTVKPGLQYINPCTERMFQVNRMTDTLKMYQLTVLTKDNITIMVDASVLYRIINSYKASYKVENLKNVLLFHCYATLRNICGVYTLQELLEKRTEVSGAINQQVSEGIDQWGVTIDNIYINDILLSQDQQSALSAAAKEMRLADAKIISAKADVESAKLMREAADALNSKSAMQIRFLETIQSLAKSSSTKVVFLPDKQQDKQMLQHKMTQGLLY